MKKIGFSLAEVLITLGIIGVIAAITLPSLQMSVEKQKVGPSLMKAVNTLEVANSVALQVEEAATLDEIGTDNNKGYLSFILQDYTKLVKVTYDGGDAYATKDGVVLKEAEEGKLSNGTASARFSGKYYTVDVDINGDKGPNKDGRDKFILYVDTKGIVLPYGSKLGEGYTKSWSKTLWETGCKSNEKGKTKVKPSKALSCTGSIVDNGGRVLYFYEGI